MLHRPIPLALFLGVVSFASSILPSSVLADVYVETGYLPTSSLLGLSPSLVSTSYVVPTSYFPTSYIPTSAVIASDPVIYPTSTTILRRSFFRPRRYVARTFTSYSYGLTPTSYVSPTSYLLPTSYVSSSNFLPTSYLSSYSIAPTSYAVDNGVVTTSDSSSSYPCETVTTAPRSSRSTATPSTNDGSNDSVITSRPSNGGIGNERRPQGMVSGEEAPPSNVNPPAPREIPAPVTVPGVRPETTPPTPPLEEPKPDAIKLPEPGRSGGNATQPNEMSFRSSRRPSYDGRNILRGRVVAAESRRPEEGVTVIISNVTKNYTDRPAMTDADGEFKVSLPDGDWVVKVKMPSGTVYPVGREFVTASNGRVTDSSGRNVAEFLITR